MARYWSISAVPVSAHPPPLVITTKLAAAIYGGAATTNINILFSTAPVVQEYTVDANAKSILQARFDVPARASFSLHAVFKREAPIVQ